MKHTFQNSSSLHSCEYDENCKELTIHFHSGSSHCYKGVQKEAVEALKKATSPGTHFHAAIRGRYQSDKVK